MRMSRRMAIGGIGGGGVSLSYTGDYDYFGNTAQGFAVLKTSGVLTIHGTVDLCLVGGGGRGYNGYTVAGSVSSWQGGGGGAGGFVENHLAQALNGDVAVTIGAGSTVQGSAGGQTKIGTSYTANGGNSPAARQVSITGRGTSGQGANGGYSGTDATQGEDGVYPWNDSANFSSYRVSGCGGGGNNFSNDSAPGGAGGGGDGGYRTDGEAGTANTGGGGGGGGTYGSSSSPSPKSGGNGGSGVVFICWGYNH